MCLEYVDAVRRSGQKFDDAFADYDDPETVFKGFKVMLMTTVEGDTQYYPLFINGAKKDFKFRKWNEEEDFRFFQDTCVYVETAEPGDISEYETGFHLFLNKEDAINYVKMSIWTKNVVIVECEFKNVTALGSQDGYHCVVCKSILPLRIVRKIFNVERFSKVISSVF